MEQKPAHLGPDYAAQFGDESVARAYSTRPPYPAEFFDVMETLLPEGPRTLLDLGCGTGDVAIPLAERFDRVDAVDPSQAMLAVARSRPGADHPSLHWISGSAEEFEPRGPYSLVVAGESLHWMDWRVVPARIAAALHPEGFLALAIDRALLEVPWADDLAKLIPKYSTNKEFRPYDLVAELAQRGLFREVGRQTTGCLPFSQTIDDYVESFHTRNGFSRERMAPQQAAEFDRAVRSLVAVHCQNGNVQGHTSTTVVWGVPTGV